MSRQLSISDLAEITDKSDRTLRKKLEGLAWTPGPKGAKLYSSKEALLAIYAGITDDLNTERARLTKLQAQKTQIEIDRLNATLVPTSEVARIVGAEYSNVRARLLSIPSRCAKDLSLETDASLVKDRLDQEVIEALSELTADEQFEENTHVEQPDSNSETNSTEDAKATSET